jgi:hypothetical protein
MKVIDCHCHLGRYFNFNVPGHSPEDMIKAMDNSGIDISCISPHMSLTSDNVRGNRFMLDTVTRYPDRFVGFITYNPHYPEEMKILVPELFMNPGVGGVKIHQGTHKTTIKNPSYRFIYEFASEHRLPVLIHSWDLQTIMNIEEISAEYPEIKFITGHFGAIPANMEYAARVVRSRNNVFGDTTVSMMYEKNIEWLVEIAGEDKILFGTDTPFYDPRPNIGRILSADISEAAKEKILGRTMEAILGNVKKYEDS